MLKNVRNGEGSEWEEERVEERAIPQDARCKESREVTRLGHAKSSFGEGSPATITTRIG